MSDREALIRLKQWMIDSAAMSPLLVMSSDWLQAACQIDQHLANVPDPYKRIRILENQVATLRKKRRPHPEEMT